MKYAYLNMNTEPLMSVHTGQGINEMCESSTSTELVGLYSTVEGQDSTASPYAGRHFYKLIK